MVHFIRHVMCLIVMLALPAQSEISVYRAFCDTEYCFCEQGVITCFQLPSEDILNRLETTIPPDYRNFVIRLMEDAALEAERLRAVFTYFSLVQTFYKGRRYEYLPPTRPPSYTHTPGKDTKTPDETLVTEEHFTGRWSMQTPSTPRCGFAVKTTQPSPPIVHAGSSQQTMTPVAAHNRPCPTSPGYLEGTGRLERLENYTWANRLGVIAASGLITLCIMIPCAVKGWRVCKRRRRRRGGRIYIGPRVEVEGASRLRGVSSIKVERPSTPPPPPPGEHSVPSEPPPTPPSGEEEHVYEIPEPLKLLNHEDVCKKLGDPLSETPTSPPLECEKIQMQELGEICETEYKGGETSV